MLTCEKPRRRRQEYPVGIYQLRASYLPAQDRQLVTEHHDLQILGEIRSKPEQHQGEDPLDQHIKHGEDHGR